MGTVDTVTGAAEADLGSVAGCKPAVATGAAPTRAAMRGRRRIDIEYPAASEAAAERAGEDVSPRTQRVSEPSDGEQGAAAPAGNTEEWSPIGAQQLQQHNQKQRRRPPRQRRQPFDLGDGDDWRLTSSSTQEPAAQIRKQRRRRGDVTAVPATRPPLSTGGSPGNFLLNLVFFRSLV